MRGSLSHRKRSMVLIVCNALDDATRIERRITTDSPAASRKVFMMAKALELAGLKPIVLSLGRGRVDDSGDIFAAKVCRVNGVPTIYAPFSHRRGISELLSLFGLLKPLLRLAKCREKAVIFYNRIPAYLPLLYVARRLSYRSFLDLEDGEVSTGNIFQAWLTRMTRNKFDRICYNGAILACSKLADMTSIRPVICYYGTSADVVKAERWQTKQITCLMAGTLASDTGAPLLIEAIKRLRIGQPHWASRVRFEITGKGESLAEFEQLASESIQPTVKVHGRTTDARYLEILGGCEVGLSLKPVGGALADTTFPSKVIEFMSSGLLVLATDISDVRSVLGDSALYLENNDPELLIRLLAGIVADPEAAALRALRGSHTAENLFAPKRAGELLHQFLFGSLR